MSRILVIGAGGVSRVAVHKCAQLPEVFSEIHLASRTPAKCQAIASEIRGRYGREIRIHTLDADDVRATTQLLREIQPALLLHLALPYQDLNLMEACLAAGVPYLDTANYEPPETARFEYRWQWAYHERFQKAGLMALLGSGFDPGVTSVFAMHALKHHFDEIHSIDIIDCNAGQHGLPFATNFNPEINLREVTAPGRWWKEGQWQETEPLSVQRSFDFPGGIGPKPLYLMYHEELESLAKFVPGVKELRFWMTFSESYLQHLKVLENVGLTRIDPIDFQGRSIVPLQFLKALLPKPESLAPRTIGQTCIGNLIRGRKDGQPRLYYIYNLCDHQAAFRETNSQAISYTTGVPAMIGAKQMLEGTWTGRGVFNIEQMDPDPFLADLSRHGLPWEEKLLDPATTPLIDPAAPPTPGADSP